MKLTTLIKVTGAVFAVTLNAIGFTAHAENIPGVAEQSASYFYTGKPYDADLGEYTFAFRNYSPQINRWSTFDPSGFPDGANNSLYVNNGCLIGIDPDGLDFLVYRGGQLEHWDGNGWVSATSIDWGTKQTSWAATSGPHGNGRLPNGWYSVGSSEQTLGTMTDNPPSRESDWQVNGAWEQGTMSAWHANGRASGHTQYKFELKPTHGTNVGGRSGFKIHPDGRTAGTEGCVGITGYDNAVSVRSFLGSQTGLELYVE